MLLAAVGDEQCSGVGHPLAVAALALGALGHPGLRVRRQPWPRARRVRTALRRVMRMPCAGSNRAAPRDRAPPGADGRPAEAQPVTDRGRLLGPAMPAAEDAD